jgi:hypothetical protein
VAPEDFWQWKQYGIRAGTHLPGYYICAYVYHWSTPKDFYCVARDPKQTIRITLTDYDQLGKVTVQVDQDQDVEKIADQIRQLLKH